MPLIAFFLVFATGSAINIQNSADPSIDSPKEFIERAIDGVEEGYSKDEFTSFHLND